MAELRGTSNSFASLGLRPIQAQHRSTAQRLGWTAEPLRPGAAPVGQATRRRGSASPVAAIIGAFLAGGFAPALGQVAFATLRSVPTRPAPGALYAIPAGFHALKGLAEIGGAGETWTLMFGSIGAIVIGATAWVRVAALAGPADEAPTVSCAS